MNDFLCRLCGAFPDDGKGPGYMARHRESAMHLAMIRHTQEEILRVGFDTIKRRWVDSDGLWLVEETRNRRTELNQRELEAVRIEEAELLIQKGRVFHIPLPGHSGTALCGLVLRSYELVDRFNMPVGETLFRICEVCDSDGALQAEELERVQMEIRTCPYCLGVFGSVGARKAHEEECGL